MANIGTHTVQGVSRMQADFVLAWKSEELTVFERDAIMSIRKDVLGCVYK